MTIPDQGADHSADRKPREVRGELITQLRRHASDNRYIAQHLSEQNNELAVEAGKGRLAEAIELEEAATALATQDAHIKELERVLKDTHASLSEFRPILQRHLDNIFLLAPNDEQRAAVLNGNAYRTAVARVERMNTAIESAQLALKPEAR